jgi:hypothetical protein
MPAISAEKGYLELSLSKSFQFRLLCSSTGFFCFFPVLAVEQIGFEELGFSTNSPPNKNSD